jgi:hypothetical protein
MVLAHERNNNAWSSRKASHRGRGRSTFFNPLRCVQGDEMAWDIACDVLPELEPDVEHDFDFVHGPSQMRASQSL